MGLYNEAGTMEQEYSYDAWGKRRLVDNWNSNISFNTDNFLTVRGYTSHEHLDKVNLINMPACRTLGRNGRLYSLSRYFIGNPLTARMLSPDPFVQSPDYTQSYNRYSYCFNNPLKYVDPSGYTALEYIIQWMWDNTPENGWSHWSGETGFVSGNDFNQCPFVTLPSQSGAEGANSDGGPNHAHLQKVTAFENFIRNLFNKIFIPKNRETTFAVHHKKEEVTFYVDIEGNQIKEDLIDKYLAKQDNGDDLSEGEKNALRRTKINPFPENAQDGDNMNYRFRIWLGNNVKDGSVIRVSPYYRSNFDNYLVSVNFDTSEKPSFWSPNEHGFAKATNPRFVNFSTTGIFSEPNNTELKNNPVRFNLIITKVL